MAKWTPEDELAAIKQGWSLFTVDSGNVVIQKLDDPPMHHQWQDGMITDCPFESDGEAIRFVRREARKGNSTAAKAIATHDANIRQWRMWQQGR